MVPFGIIGGRLYHVITRREPYFGDGGDPVHAALHLAGRPRHLGRHRARRRRRLDRLPAPRHPAAALRRRAGAGHRARPGHRPARQLLQPGALRQGRPTCRGALEIDPAHRPRRLRGAVAPTTRRSSTSCSGTSASPRWSSGPTAASGSATAGRSRCTSRRTPSAAAGSRPCGSTRRNHVLGLRLNDWTSLLVFLGAVVYFVVSRPAATRPGDTGGVEALRRDRAGEDQDDAAADDTPRPTDEDEVR